MRYDVYKSDYDPGPPTLSSRSAGKTAATGFPRPRRKSCFPRDAGRRAMSSMKQRSHRGQRNDEVSSYRQPPAELAPNPPSTRSSQKQRRATGGRTDADVTFRAEQPPHLPARVAVVQAQHVNRLAAISTASALRVPHHVVGDPISSGGGGTGGGSRRGVLRCRPLAPPRVTDPVWSPSRTFTPLTVHVQLEPVDPLLEGGILALPADPPPSSDRSSAAIRSASDLAITVASAYASSCRPPKRPRG
jgi:hypothetical protein